MSKFMRILLFFDLPTKTKTERHDAAKFRKFLKDDGYYMMQWSVYSRICNGADSVSMHEQRVLSQIPERGSIRVLVLTEKQYESIDILLGDKTANDTEKSTKLVDVF